MTERPILFSGAMVRALLDGTKTQTRRAAKPVKHPDLGNLYDPGALVLEREPQHVIERASPYGQAGDRLWVRETTHRRPMLNLLTGEPLAPKYDGGAYTADGADVLTPDGFDIAWWYSRKSCPSIHMPRWASRILLEITGVRVERLQDISEADSIAEGIEQMPCAVPDTRLWRNYDPSNGWTRSLALPQNSYRSLWSSIDGPGSWEANPWVWVVEFRRVES